MSGFWDIFKNTGTAKPYNNFGRTPEEEVRTLVKEAISKVDWSKAGLNRGTGSYRYGEEIYKEAYKYAVRQAHADAHKQSMEDITADKVMKEQFDGLAASKKKLDAAIRDLSDMASLVQATLTDAGFPEIAKEMAGRFDGTHERVAEKLASSERYIALLESAGR